jgi:hypothetical protein
LAAHALSNSLHSRASAALSDFVERDPDSKVCIARTASPQPRPPAASHKSYVMDVPSQGFGTCRFVFCGNVACRTCIGPLLVLCLVVTSRKYKERPGVTQCVAILVAHLAMASHGKHVSLRHEDQLAYAQFRACETGYESTAEARLLTVLPNPLDRLDTERRKRILGKPRKVRVSCMRMPAAGVLYDSKYGRECGKCGSRGVCRPHGELETSSRQRSCRPFSVR